MPRGREIACILACAVLFGLIPSVAAQDYSWGGDISSKAYKLLAPDPNATVPDAYDGFLFTLLSGDSMRISVSVTNGGEIDVYIADQSSYLNQYKTGSSLRYFPSASKESTKSHSTSVSYSDISDDVPSGKLAVLVENCDCLVGGAAGSGPVDYTITMTKSTIDPGLLFGLAFAVLAVICIIPIVILILIIWLVLRRKKAAVAPPPMAPGYPGYYPPPPPGGAPPPPPPAYGGYPPPPPPAGYPPPPPPPPPGP